jgi:flagellar hook-associated protein 3 FlgL
VKDEVAFAGNPAFPVTGIEIRFDPTDPKRYDVYGIPAAAVLASGRMDADDSTSDQLVFRGVSLLFDGAPVGGETVQITADPAREKQGILSTIAKLRTALENPATGPQVRDAVAVALTNLDHGITTVDSVRGEIGARLNIIESTQTDNEDVTLINKGVQAELRELDYAEALSRMSFQTIILEAAQQSYVKISSLNLFNLLR